RFAQSGGRGSSMAVSGLRRVVIDTNVWISAFINPLGEPGRLLNLALLGQMILVVSDYLLAEILAVSQRPRVRWDAQLAPLACRPRRRGLSAVRSPSSRCRRRARSNRSGTSGSGRPGPSTLIATSLPSLEPC